ncbi:VOC family protein [Streptomyces sp. CHD11]|uniref:VOC family protein n=1 Tax=Streptomyces sp. CHD11 TaxID=2741325 RepID=UPI001BFC3382|nr:VOC family protein [Streptomyces sp. CHD11]MBT3154951.1 VOC family protein [Streptomyces sp. CHD11]
MQITVSTVSLTVDDVTASQQFFTTHLGYKEIASADGFASLTRGGAAVDIVLLHRGNEVLPAGRRDQHAAGVVLAFTVTNIEEEERRLREEGAAITMPLRQEPWGERLVQVTDPNGVIVQLVEWVTPPGPSGDRSGEPVT